MIKLLLVILTVFAVTGCNTSSENDTLRMNAGKLRQDLFVVCMNLASQNARSGDDDVSDIVKECDSYAYSTSKQTLNY